MKKKILIICGPTATGKTGLAVRLAEKFNGELISADSRQVYQGMDIGTGKDHPRETKIHLLDLVKPDQEFSVFHYCRLAEAVIKKLWQQGKLPILVGGTGFYLKAVIEGVATKDIPPNPKVRQGMKDWGTEELYVYLSELDSFKAASMNQSDQQNPRRLIRAIEIALFKKENPGFQEKKTGVKQDSVLWVGLKTDYPTLYQRIDQRVERRVKLGAEKEISQLLDQGYRWQNSALGVTLGYREWQDYFEGKASKQQVIKAWQGTEHGYARRQMTWFRKALRQAQGSWFEIDKRSWQIQVEKLVKSWYDRGNHAAKS